MRFYLRERSTAYYVNAVVLALAGFVIIATRPQYPVIGWAMTAASVAFMTMLFVRGVRFRLRAREDSLLLQVARDVMLGQGLRVKDLRCQKCGIVRATMCDACISRLLGDALAAAKGGGQVESAPPPF